MSKFKDFCAKPITWGAYFKLCGICVAAGMTVSAWTMHKIKKDFESYNFE